MRNVLLILTAVSFFSITLHGQYPMIPKTGEGRYDRSSETVFWPNTIFTHPSIFFREGQTDVRPMRKWWRAPLRTVSPVPVSLPKEEPFNPALISAAVKSGLNPLDRDKTTGAEQLFSRASNSLSNHSGIMILERDSILPATNCRLTDQILNQLHPSGETGFLFPVHDNNGSFFP